jgi:tetratricopeptide (TPR) repeat protein
MLTSGTLLFAATLSCAAAVSCTRKAESPAPTPTSTVPELIAQAEDLYRQRESFERAREAVAVIRRARALDNSSYEATWRLSKYTYYLGEYGSDEPQRLEGFREGITSGEAAIKIEPNRPEGHFWLGANLGGRAKLQGPIYALSSVPEIRREMETVIRLDEGFQNGSAFLALGQLELELGMLGGNPERAVEYLEKGLRYGEQNSLLRVRLAEAYLAVKRNDDARRQLDAVLKMNPSHEYEHEHKQAVASAKKILETRL